MKISNREIIIAAIAILVLLGIGYFINNNSEENKAESTQEDNVNLDEGGSDESKESVKEDVKEPQGVVSTEPSANAEITISSAPKSVVIKFDKEIAGGSEIKVVSDKGVDVVTAGNKITTDLKQLSAPVSITTVGTYSVTYAINWGDGTKSDGSYKFTVK